MAQRPVVLGAVQSFARASLEQSPNIAHEIRLWMMPRWLGGTLLPIQVKSFQILPQQAP